MGGVRRSGRIKKQIGILLLGTDTSGRVFSEETVTVVLSRHGAGVLSTYRLAPDEILTLRLLGTSKEVEARLVGQMGQETRGYTYGVAFVDPNLDFWQIDFPPSNSQPQDIDHPLQCSLCRTRELVHQSEIEADVYAIAEGILRSCRVCGTSTLWRRATGERVVPAAPSRAPSAAAPLPAATDKHSTDSIPHAPIASTLLAGPSQLSVGETTVLFDAEQRAPAAVDIRPPDLSPPLSPDLRGVRRDHSTNRRGGVRTGVTFTACIRHAESGDEIVECDNISRGGLCFRSRKRYVVDSLIEVAAPFSPGWHAIFVPASIRHVEQLPNGTLFRYGIAYTQPRKSSRSS